MNTRESLQRLVALSRIERAQKAITAIDFHIVIFAAIYKKWIRGTPMVKAERDKLDEMTSKMKFTSLKRKALYANWAELDRDRRAWLRRNYDRQRHDQNTMRTTGADVELLTEALCNLPALKSIRSVLQYDLKDPPLAGRELFVEISIIPSSGLCTERQATTAHAISLILGAIIRSKRQLQILELHSLPYSLPLSQTPTSRRLSRTSTPPKTLAQDQLDQLHLSKLTSFTLVPPGVKNTRHGDVSDECPFLWLTPLVSRMVSLHKLCLGGSYAYRVEAVFLRFLAYTDAKLPQLKTLELHGLGFRHQELTLVFRNVGQTLEKFICMHCCSIAGTNRDVIRTLEVLPMIVHAQLVLLDTESRGKQRWRQIKKTPEQFKESLSTYLNSPQGPYAEYWTFTDSDDGWLL